MSSKILESRIALITGANGEIGTSTARLLASRGASIAALDRRGSDWTALREVLPHGTPLLCLEGDVTDEKSVQACVVQTTAHFGTIDIFFNNAGIEGPNHLIQDYPLDAFRAVIDVNVIGVFLGLKYVLPIMYAQQRGSIINASSVSGLVGSPGMIGYNSSKHAVVGLTRVAATEAAKHAVRVNCINPGPIESRMMQSINGSHPAGNSRRIVTDMIPAKRYGTPDEVAALVAFLASDEAGYCNGGVYTVDGGRHIV